MKNKKVLSLVIALVLVGAIGVGATLAYFTDSDAATNVITMGHVDIDLTEPNFDKPVDDPSTPDVDESQEEKDNKIENIVPGQEIVKDPTITVAEDSEDAYIRAKVTFAGLTYTQQTELIDGIKFLKDENGEDLWNVEKTVYMSEDDLSIDDWDVELVCYYNEVVTAGTSKKLFDKVIIPADWGNEVADLSFEINVTAEAIQASNFTPEYDADDNIVGWNDVTVETYEEKVVNAPQGGTTE